MKVADAAAATSSSSPTFASANVGNYVAVRIDSSNGITLRGSKVPYTFVQSLLPIIPFKTCFYLKQNLLLFIFSFPSAAAALALLPAGAPLLYSS
jgi:hypothetical protein